MPILIRGLLLALISVTIAVADIDGSVIEVRGTIQSYNSKYIYLKYKGKKTVAPVKFATKKQLKSKKEISIFVPTGKYNVMLRDLKNKRKR